MKKGFGLGGLLALCAAASGCAGSQRAAPPAKAGAEFGRVSGKPDARRWLGGDATRARRAGAQDSQVIAIDAGISGDRVSGLVRVPAQDCALLIARAADSVDDVDLFAYGDDGTALGSDEGMDKTPTLLVCPPHPARLFVVARIASGQGMVAIGAQRVGLRDSARVARALSARGAAGDAADRLRTWPALDEALAAHYRALGSRWVEAGRLAAPLDPRIATRVSAVVEANRCLDALIVPSEEVNHIDVSVLDLRGHIVGRAAGAGRERSVVLCAPTKTPITFEIRPHIGRGLAAVILSRSAIESSRELERSADAFDLGPMGDLGDTRAKNSQRLEQAGYERAKVVSQGALEVGRRTSIAVELPQGCARLDVFGGAPARGVEAWLWRDDGSLVASDRGNGQATLFACGSGGKARLDAEAVLRPGRYALELRRESSAPKVLEREPLAASRLLASLVSRGVIQSGGQVGAPALVQLSPTQLSVLPVAVPAGRCVDITLSLGTGSTGAEIRLLDLASNAEVAFARGTYTADTTACAQNRGALNMRAELRTANGSGSALVTTRLLPPGK